MKTSSNSFVFATGPPNNYNRFGGESNRARSQRKTWPKNNMITSQTRIRTGKKKTFSFSGAQRFVFVPIWRENETCNSKLEFHNERSMDITNCTGVEPQIHSKSPSNSNPIQPSLSQVKTDLIDQERKSM